MKKGRIVIYLCLFFLFANFADMKAQDAIITLRDSVKIRTQILYIVENQVKTKAGILGLGEIYSVRFQTEAEAKEEWVVQFKNAGVEVYAANKRLVEAESSKSPLLQKQAMPKTTRPNTIASLDGAVSGFSGFSLGFGLGWDYGFLGARATYLFNPNIGVFAGGGYNLADFGGNVGLLTLLSQKRAVPTLSFMYGVNAAIYVSGSANLSKSFSGSTAGLGMILKGKYESKNFWHFQLLLPFRSSDFDTYYNNLINTGAIQNASKPLPVNISVGYHFTIN